MMLTPSSFFTVGTALVVVGGGLAGIATGSPAGGWEIPAIDGSIIDKPIPYIPVCSAGSFPVCVHPAYRDYLPQVTSALKAVVAQLAGLPGVPVRAREVPQSSLPPVLEEGNGNGQVTDGVYEFTMNNALALVPDDSMLRSGFVQDIVHAVIVGSIGKIVTSTPGGTGLQPNNGTAAQQAVEDGLLKALGAQPYPVGGPSNSKQFQQQQKAVAKASAKFAALPAATRHAWLVANLAALRAGTITLARLP